MQHASKTTRSGRNQNEVAYLEKFICSVLSCSTYAGKRRFTVDSSSMIINRSVRTGVSFIVVRKTSAIPDTSLILHPILRLSAAYVMDS
eukprot:scaffold3156_cov268-Chaetoceros_neogracile.AAC.24